MRSGTSTFITAIESGFHMHQNFSNLGMMGENGVFDSMGNPMALGDRNMPVHQHMEINIMANPHLADKTFPQPRHTRDGLRRLPYLLFQPNFRCGIEKLTERRSLL